MLIRHIININLKRINILKTITEEISRFAYKLCQFIFFVLIFVLFSIVLIKLTQKFKWTISNHVKCVKLKNFFIT